MDNSEGQELSAPADRLGFLVYRAGLAVSRGYERELAPLGASPVEVGVLSALAYAGPAHVRGLSRGLGIGRQTAVNVTRALQAAGLIERQAAEGDARLVVYAATEAGRERLAQCETVVRAFDARLRETVGAEAEAALIGHLRKIAQAPFLGHEE